MRLNIRVTGPVLVFMLLAAPLVSATGADLHWLWDNRCAECHGHSGEFSRSNLRVVDGQLQGRHHADDLRRFLGNHYLAGNDVDAIYNMLLAQAVSQARFKDECAGCHGSAAGFVRSSLELCEGMLYGRNSGRPVDGFLSQHMALGAADVVFYNNLLTRIANEVYRQ